MPLPLRQTTSPRWSAHPYGLYGNQTVSQMWWTGSAWTNQNLGPTAASGSGLTNVIMSDGPHVFYLDQNDSLNQLFLSGSSWVNQGLGVGAAPGRAITSQSLSDGPHIFYVDSNRHVDQLWYTISAGTWSVQDLTSLASGPLAWQVVKISGQVLAGGSGLSGAIVTLTGTIWSSTNSAANGNYSIWVPAGGSYTVTPSYSGYAFSPPSQTFSNVNANQTAQSSSLQPATCTGQATVPSNPPIAGSSMPITVNVSSAPTTVSFTMTGANTNPYSNSISATRVGSSLTDQATLNTSGMLGEYKVLPVVNSPGAQYRCSSSINFFNVITGQVPTQPGAINCTSMAGTWADVATNEPTFSWFLTGTGSSISGHVTVADPGCNNEIITLGNVTGTYNSSTRSYSLDGTNSTKDSCGTVALEQKLSGSIQANACGLGSGTFVAVGGSSGPNTVTVTERIPTGETSSATGWLDQYGLVTTAQFNMVLSANGYNFGGRTVTEKRGSPTQGSDTCHYSGAPWNPMLTLATEDSWNVQNNGQNGNYGPDLVGLSADLIAYVQAFSPTLGSGCSISYPQIMVINKETATTGTEPYGSTNTGDNTIKFTITPTSIGVQRGNASVTRTFHF